MSNLRAKPSYDESGRKKALLNKFRRHADPLIIPSAKKAHSLTLTVGIYGEKVGTKQFVSPYIESPICITPDSSSLTTSTSPIETSKSWKRRKNSLGKIVTYPTKILGKILPRYVNTSESRFTLSLWQTRRSFEGEWCTSAFGIIAY